MNHLNRDRSLAHGGGYALDRRMTCIACREDSRNNTLENEGIAVFLPTLRTVAIAWQERASEQVAAFVHGELASQPRRARHRADEDKQGSGRHGPRLAGFGV